MDWIILSADGGTVENIIEANEAFADELGCVPFYPGAMVGRVYSPPKPPPTEMELLQQRITDLDLARIEQGQFQTAMELMILEGGANV